MYSRMRFTKKHSKKAVELLILVQSVQPLFLKIGLFYFCGWQMGGKSPKTSTQHRRNADNTIKKTFAYFNKALSFYSHFVHIFTVYYKRSRKDAPFYFRLQSPSPKGCRHPFPYWKKNIERKKQTTTYIWFIIVIYPPLYRKSSPNRLLFL